MEGRGPLPISRKLGRGSSPGTGEGTDGPAEKGIATSLPAPDKTLETLCRRLLDRPTRRDVKAAVERVCKGHWRGNDDETAARLLEAMVKSPEAIRILHLRICQFELFELTAILNRSGGAGDTDRLLGDLLD